MLRKTISSQYFQFAIFLLLFGYLVVQLMIDNDYLFTLDPWNHYFFSRFGEAQEFFTRWVMLRNAEVVSHYRSILRSNAYLLSLTSGLDLFQIFRWGSIILRLLYFLIAYNLLKLVLKDFRISVIALLLMLSSYYFVLRSIIYWPENLVMIFYLFALWALEKYRQTGNVKYAYLVALSVAGGLMAHTPSVFALGIILLSYVIYFLVNGQQNAIKHLVFSGLIGVLAVYPLIYEIGRRVYLTLVYNFGEDSPWGQVVSDSARYSPPEFETFNYFLGPVLVLFTLIGVGVLLQRGVRKNAHLIAYFALSLLLSLSLYFDLFLPADRVQAYLMLPVVVLVAVALRFIFVTYHHVGWFRPLFVSILFVFSVINMARTETWFAYFNGEINAGAAANILLEGDPEAVIYVDPTARNVVNLIDYPERICVIARAPELHPNLEPQDLDGRCEAPDFYLTTEFEVEGYQFFGGYGNYNFFSPQDS